MMMMIALVESRVAGGGNVVSADVQLKIRRRIIIIVIKVILGTTHILPKVLSIKQ